MFTMGTRGHSDSHPHVTGLSARDAAVADLSPCRFSNCLDKYVRCTLHHQGKTSSGTTCYRQGGL